MAELEIKCQHACKNTCAILNEALRRETAMVRFYESVLDECNMPGCKFLYDGTWLKTKEK